MNIGSLLPRHAHYRPDHLAVVCGAHRLTFRQQQKDHLVFLANKFAIAGLAFLALAMTGAILLITDVLFSTAAAIVVAALALCVFSFFWFVLPLQRRLRLSAGQEPLGKPEKD